MPEGERAARPRRGVASSAGVSIGRLISGGQTGADRAALDVALLLGIPYGGWCPAGGWAEDMPSPPGLLALYPSLREAPAGPPSVRTRLNVRDSDATLVVRGPGVHSPGTSLTVSVASELQRPCLVTAGSVSEVASWLAGLSDLPGLGRPLTLNVAGPRESNQPGVYAVTRDLLLAVLGGSG